MCQISFCGLCFHVWNIRQVRVAACDSSHCSCVFHTVVHMSARSIWIIKKLLFLSELPESKCVFEDKSAETFSPSLDVQKYHPRWPVPCFLATSILLKHNLIEPIFILHAPPAVTPLMRPSAHHSLKTTEWKHYHIKLFMQLLNKLTEAGSQVSDEDDFGHF